MGRIPNPTGKGGFKKGQIANPGGKPSTPPEVKVLQTLTKQELVTIGSLLLKGEVEQLRLIAKDPKEQPIRAWFAAVSVKAIEKGDAAHFEKLLHYIVGKPKEVFEVQGSFHAQLVDAIEKVSKPD